MAVSGTVAEVLEPNAFTLVGDGTAADEEPVEDEAVLVAGDDRNPRLTEGQTVRVAGALQRFTLAALEEELDNACYRVYPKRPATFAQHIWQVKGEGTASR